LGNGLFCLLKILGLENKIKGFAVSDYTDHLDDFMDIPIKNISEYELDNVSIIIAVKRKYLDGILRQMGGRSCYYMGIHALKEMFEQDCSAASGWLKTSMQEAGLTEEQYVTFCTRQLWRTQLDFEVQKKGYQGMDIKRKKWQNCRICPVYIGCNSAFWAAGYL